MGGRVATLPPEPRWIGVGSSISEVHAAASHKTPRPHQLRNFLSIVEEVTMSDTTKR
jgi:hypothetical protein